MLPADNLFQIKSKLVQVIREFSFKKMSPCPYAVYISYQVIR